MIREFRLSEPSARRGVSCDANGAFIGAIPLLKRLSERGKDWWAPRDSVRLSKQMALEFGLPIDMSRKAGGLRAICNALNDGDIVRAQIAAVLLGIPDAPASAKGKPSRDQMIKFIRDLDWSGMIKADWDPDEHPRWPAGSGQGGQFAPEGEGDGECNRTETARRRWMRRYNRDWPLDEKTGRKQDVAHIRARADGGGDEPENIRPLPHDEHVREHMERGDFSRWALRRGKNATSGPKSTPSADAKEQSETKVRSTGTTPKPSRVTKPSASQPSPPKSTPGTGAKEQPETNARSMRATPKASRATSPDAQPEPTPDAVPRTEEPTTLEEFLLEDPFFIPE